jgi:hypothetical protein
VSNDVFLAGGNDPSPARPLGPDWTYSYEYYGADTLAGCSYGIPLLWLFCFDSGSLITYDASDLGDSQWTVASAVIETDRAGQLFMARQPRLRRWPGASAYSGEFAELIRIRHRQWLGSRRPRLPCALRPHAPGRLDARARLSV